MNITIFFMLIVNSTIISSADFLNVQYAWWISDVSYSYMYMWYKIAFLHFYDIIILIYSNVDDIFECISNTLYYFCFNKKVSYPRKVPNLFLEGRINI